MQGVLTPAIELWSFGSSGGFPSPHFGNVSLILILSQSRVATKEVRDTNLVANGKFQAWWPLECSMFGGLWNESNVWRSMGKHLSEWPMEGSNVWWPLEGEGKTSFSPPSTFHPIKILFKFFSIDFRVLLYHGSRPLLHNFPSFSLIYKLQSHISRYQVFHTFIAKLILVEDFFLFLNSWCFAWLRFMSLKP